MTVIERQLSFMEALNTKIERWAPGTGRFGIATHTKLEDYNLGSLRETYLQDFVFYQVNKHLGVEWHNWLKQPAHRIRADIRALKEALKILKDNTPTPPKPGEPPQGKNKK